MENKNLLMLNTSSTAVSVFDESMDCIDCSEPTLSLFCFEKKEDYLAGFFRTMPPFQANGMPSSLYFKRLLSSAFLKGRINAEIMCQRTDGILIPADLTLIRTEADGETFVVGSFYSLAKLKQDMKKAVSASEIAQLYLSSAPLAMELFNDQYRIIDCNQQAIELLGFPRKARYMKRNLPDMADFLYHDSYTLRQDEANYQKALSDGYNRYEWVFQKENGDKIPCEITRVRIITPERIFVVSYIHDLSKIKALAEELKKAEASERENRAKNQFLAQMSHVLRTPLNVITGITEIQLQKKHSAEIEETFLQIQRSSEMLLRIINDILDLSNADSGELDILAKNIDVPSLIVDIAQQVIIERELDSVKLVLKVDENLPSTLIGDEVRIKQIVNSLLTNAFQYTKEGFVTLEFSAEPHDEFDMTLTVSVKDTGQGMSPMQVKNLFVTERVRYNEQGTIQGVGLGLVVIHRILQMMKGTINVESELGKGSDFTIRIPLNKASETTLGEENARKLESLDNARDMLKKRKLTEYEPMPYGSVLVVDDVESNLYVAWGLMKPYGLTIDTAVGGIEAVQKIKDGGQYDIIFMDHMMPDLDGIQTAKAIKELGCDFPIVALTANVIMGQAALFEENGFAGFISKPIDMKQLDSYLMRLIRDKYPEEAQAARENAVPVVVEQFSDVSNELAKHFIRDAKNAVNVLEKLMQHSVLNISDTKLYTITTHGMKSALANVNVKDLSDIAAILEAAGRNSDMERIKAQTPPFIMQLQDVIATFEKNLETETDNIAEDDMVLLKKQFGLLIEACDNYSKPAAKRAVNAIKAGQCSSATLQLLDDLNALLLHGEFEEAAEMAQKYLEGHE